MRPDEYACFDALDLAGLIKDRQVSPEELVDVCEYIVDALDGSINAVVSRHFDLARGNASARGAHGPFFGVPFGAKEEGAYYRGVPSGAASRLIVPEDPGYDTNFVTRYKQAGLNLVAKLNMPELAASVSTESRVHGPCRNPWDPDLSPGGSSGGSAAAVAAGYFPAAYANDGAGSIRIPSSCCGVFGFKPSRGRVPKGPLLLDEWAGNVVDHVITRSVRDSAAILDVSSGVDVGAPYDAPTTPGSFADSVGVLGRPLRIGYSTTSPNGVPVDSECVIAARTGARLCHDLGHEVVEASPHFDAGEMFDRLFVHMSVHLAKEVRNLFAYRGIEPGPELLEPSNFELYRRGLEVSAADYVDNLFGLGRIARRASAFFETHDVWLCPALARASLGLGEITTADAGSDFWQAWARFTPFTPLANIAGHPAMSVPLHWTEAGLPVGVHCQAKIGDEAVLFGLAGQLEQVAPWRDRVPKLSARALLAA